jgi:hypothetical protein
VPIIIGKWYQTAQFILLFLMWQRPIEKPAAVFLQARFPSVMHGSLGAALKKGAPLFKSRRFALSVAIHEAISNHRTEFVATLS